MQPRANSRYARKNSQGGQSAIYSTAPEYDDPATCAEEDQYVSTLLKKMTVNFIITMAQIGLKIEIHGV
jgi:hypothetical protein